jgi:hypothetical protein
MTSREGLIRPVAIWKPIAMERPRLSAIFFREAGLFPDNKSEVILVVLLKLLSARVLTIFQTAFLPSQPMIHLKVK